MSFFLLLVVDELINISLFDKFLFWSILDQLAEGKRFFFFFAVATFASFEYFLPKSYLVQKVDICQAAIGLFKTREKAPNNPDKNPQICRSRKNVMETGSPIIIAMKGSSPVASQSTWTTSPCIIDRGVHKTSKTIYASNCEKKKKKRKRFIVDANWKVWK